MLINFILLLSLLEFGIADTDLIPDGIQLCKQRDHDQRPCLTEATQKYLPFLEKGFPERKVAPIDPLNVGDIKFHVGGLKAEVKHVNLYGLAKAHIKNVTINWKKEIGKISFNARQLKATAGFTVGGHVFLFTVKGHGEAVIITKNVDCEIPFKITSHEKEDGKSYMEFHSQEMTCDIIDDFNIVLTKVDEESRVIAETALALVLRQWRIFVGQALPPLFKIVGDKLIHAVNSYLRQVPEEELFAP